MDAENRYTRNILIEDIGQEGQERLRSAKVLVIGAGGLGSPVLFYLAAAGVGTLGIIDNDAVSISNLQRQILHRTDDVGRDKTLSAEEKLTALNPEVRIHLHSERFTEENAAEIIKAPDGEYDFVIDCCDNYKTKLLINDICVQLGKAYSHGAVLSMRGEAMTYIPGAACYRCVFDNPPEDGTLPTSAEVGILGAVAGMVGCIQATEAIKYLTGMDGLITNRILIIDTKTMSFTSLKVKTNNTCCCTEV